MEVFDFFEDLFDGIKDMVEEFPDFASDMAELGDELGDILTEGTKEILFKGNLEWESSREIRERATSKIHHAKQRYKQKSEQVQRLIEQVQQRIVVRYRQEIILIEALSPTQDPYPIIVQKLPSIDQYTPQIEIDNFDKIANLLFNSVFGHSIAHEEAEDALCEANHFEDLVNEKLILLNRIEENLILLHHLMDEEDDLLGIIREALKKGKRFNHDLIRQELISLLSAHVFDSKMSISSGYQVCLENIRNFCKHL